MKNYKIVASKNVIATFTMDYTTYEMQFSCPSKFVEWILSKHSEFKDCPWDHEYKRNNIIISFYSIGNLVIEEV